MSYRKIFQYDAGKVSPSVMRKAHATSLVRGRMYSAFFLYFGAQKSNIPIILLKADFALLCLLRSKPHKNCYQYLCCKIVLLLDYSFAKRLFCSHRALLTFCIMRAAVQFNNQTGFCTIKVRNIVVNDLLPLKPYRVIAQKASPKLDFPWCHVFTKRFCTRNQIFIIVYHIVFLRHIVKFQIVNADGVAFLDALFAQGV